MKPIRKMAPYLWGAVAVAGLQLGWIWLSRHLADRRMERAAEQRQQRDAGTLPPAGTALRIPWFYANSGVITEGEHAVVCYGVENAAAVRLEPPVEELKPSFNRCFAIAPKTTTTYTLTAEGADGKLASASFTVQVEPPPPRILFVSLSEKEIQRGQPWTMCYGVAHASKAWLDPGTVNLPVSEKRCMRSFPVRTTNFTLVAADDLGRTDRERFRLVVR